VLASQPGLPAVGECLLFGVLAVPPLTAVVSGEVCQGVGRKPSAASLESAGQHREAGGGDVPARRGKTAQRIASGLA
jgi:hypothetical protein